MCYTMHFSANSTYVWLATNTANPQIEIHKAKLLQNKHCYSLWFSENNQKQKYFFKSLFWSVLFYWKMKLSLLLIFEWIFLLGLVWTEWLFSLIVSWHQLRDSIRCKIRSIQTTCLMKAPFFVEPIIAAVTSAASFIVV